MARSLLIAAFKWRRLPTVSGANFIQAGSRCCGVWLWDTWKMSFDGKRYRECLEHDTMMNRSGKKQVKTVPVVCVSMSESVFLMTSRLDWGCLLVSGLHEPFIGLFAERTLVTNFETVGSSKVRFLNSTWSGGGATSIGSSSYPISLASILLLDFTAFSKELDLGTKPWAWATSKLPKKLKVN